MGQIVAGVGRSLGREWAVCTRAGGAVGGEKDSSGLGVMGMT